MVMFGPAHISVVPTVAVTLHSNMTSSITLIVIELNSGEWNTGAMER